jgi:hypothetical protein
MIFDIWGEGRRRTVTPGDKSYLIRIARGKCEYCGGEIIGKGIVPEIHHIVPHASGGSDREHNLIVLCPNCHSRVDHIPRAELRHKISYRLPKKSSAVNIQEKARKRKTTAKKSSTKKVASSKTRRRKTTTKKTTRKKAVPAKTKRRKITARKIKTRKTLPAKTRPRKKAGVMSRKWWKKESAYPTL